MGAATDIPLRYPTDDLGELKELLERFAQSMDIFTREAAIGAKRFETVDLVPSRPLLAFDRITRVAFVADGATVTIPLPPARKENIGRRCGCLRSSITGRIVISAPGSLVAGLGTYQMANDLHFVEFLLGPDLYYYPSRAGGYFE